MISETESAELGQGLYSFGEVAQYLRVNVNTLRSWFRSYGGRHPIITGSISQSQDKRLWLSFHDFIEAYIIHYLKGEGVKPPDLREAIEECKKKYNLSYPLSHKGHVVMVDRATGRVLVLPPNEHHPVEVTGPHKGQKMAMQIVRDYLRKLEFDEHTALVNRFIVMERKFPGGRIRRIVMEPGLNFGEPTVEGTPYRASTLREALMAEGDPKKTAKIYGVGKSDIIIATAAFDNHLGLR